MGSRGQLMYMKSKSYTLIFTKNVMFNSNKHKTLAFKNKREVYLVMMHLQMRRCVGGGQLLVMIRQVQYRQKVTVIPLNHQFVDLTDKKNSWTRPADTNTNIFNHT